MITGLIVPSGSVMALDPPLDVDVSPLAEVKVDELIVSPPVQNTSIVAESAESKVETKAEPVAVPEVKSAVASAPQPTPPAAPITPTVPKVVPTPPELPASPIWVTGYRRASDGKISYIQLYNNSSKIVNLAGWSVVLKSGDTEVPIELDGWLVERGYAVLAFDGEMDGEADLDISLPPEINFGSLTELQLLPPAGLFTPREVKVIAADGNNYQLSKSTAGNYTTNSKFMVATGPAEIYGGGLHQPALSSGGLRIIEILASARDCSPLDESLDCFEYVKLYNSGSEVIDLSAYRLRLGYGQEPVGINSAVHLSGAIKPSGYFVVAVRDDDKPLDVSSSGYVWLEDAHGLIKYDDTVIGYNDVGLANHKGFSWALNGTTGQWQKANPRPEGANNFDLPETLPKPAAERQPCQPGQERNPATNRCRSVTAAASVLKACKDGQYRSEETNRCRTIASAVKAELKPCADDQFRNPLTNRCKKIASLDDEALKDCGEGRERNPATNRCRNVATNQMPTAGFAAIPVSDDPAAATGWWALGAIGLLAAGYGAWEWRREISSGFSWLRQITSGPGK